MSHVAHVPTAYRIVEDQQLRADLVFDKSKLNTYRARVVWLSPNDWTNAGGFRYGNVSFAFPWERIIEGRHYYWVESMAYGVEACRILVTSNDWSKELEPYDPAKDDGPWRLDADGGHYWNGTYCLEVMVEDDVSLDMSTGVGFVGHHPKRCSIDPKNCFYLGKREREAGAEFLATLVSRREKADLPSVLVSLSDGTLMLESSVMTAFNHLMLTCHKLNVPGPGVQAHASQALALARTLLGSLYQAPTEQREQLASLFGCHLCLKKSVAKVVERAFDGDESVEVAGEFSEWLT
ncbi:MAG: hypothetical protein AB7N24_15485 [Dehalococcoidia bacterium]